MKISIVLPCYNESEGIVEILNRFKLHAENEDIELILVDNGSTDDTAKVIADNIDAYPFARCVIIEKNIGYGHGIYTGLKEATGEILAWSHADLQTDPADVFRAHRLLLSQDDMQKTIVKGVRHGRLLAERFISRSMEIVALFLLRRRINEINAQPKVFHRSLMDHCLNPPLDFNLDTYFIYQGLKHGWQVITIDVDFPPRTYGISKWASSWRSRVRHISASIKFMFLLGLGMRDESK